MEKRENHGGKIMKRVLYSVCIGSLALALTAGAAQDNKKKPERARPQHRTASVHTARPANTGRTMSAHRNVSAAQYRQPSYAKPRASSNAVVKHDTGLRAVRERNLARNERVRARNSCEFRSRILSFLARFRSRTARSPVSCLTTAFELVRGFAFDGCRYSSASKFRLV